MDRSTSSTRVSQRASFSCRECKKRKIRCDKRVPCRPCIKSGISTSCMIEPVYLTTQATKNRNEINFLRELLPHIMDVEPGELKQAITDRIQRRLNLLETGRESVTLPTNASQREDVGGIDKVLDAKGQSGSNSDTSTATMGLNRGITNQGGESSLPSISIDGVSVLELLPTQEQARALASYHLEQLCWHHNAIHTTEFLEQCEAFWNKGMLEHPLWIALYFAVLSAAAWNIPDDLCKTLFGKGNLRSQAKMWYQAVVRILYELEFLANHSMFSIQAVIVSTMIAYPLGKSSQQTILLSSCLRIAQALGLGEQCDDPKPNSKSIAGTWKEIVHTQMVRRVWWQLIIQDYFMAPKVGAYGISPSHFKTPIPINCDDYDMEERPLDQPTISSYCIALARICILMPPLIDGIRCTRSPIPLEQQYQKVQQVDAQMRDLAANLPGFLKPGTPEDVSWPEWVPWARITLTISAADKIIMIHRSFLVQSFHNPAYAFTRRTCVAAATTILNEFQRVSMTDAVKLWIIPTFTVGAAIILYLDIIYRSEFEDRKESDLQLVQETISGLKNLDYDQIACQGVRLLEALVQQKRESLVAQTLSEHTDTLPDLAKFVTRLEDGENFQPDVSAQQATKLSQDLNDNSFFPDGNNSNSTCGDQEATEMLEQWFNMNGPNFGIMEHWSHDLIFPASDES